ncbi:MAG: hypothetical protein AAGA93_15265 [Actinomycetota bacterium]
MTGPDLPLPPLLLTLVDDGRWPATAEVARRQHLAPLVSAERIAAVADDQDSLYLYPPPFQTVAEDIAILDEAGWTFWPEFGSTHELDPALALIIGDFGLGSDSPILLDYRSTPEPTVLRLAWLDGGTAPAPPATTWVTIAPSFADFAAAIGLA